MILNTDEGPTLKENEMNESTNDNNINHDELNDNSQFESDYEVFVETDYNEPSQIDNIKTSINFPVADKKAINEFEFDSICSLLFPKLFPNGAGDPTTKGESKHFNSK